MKLEYFTLNPAKKILIVFGMVITGFVILYLLLTSLCDWHIVSCGELIGIFSYLISVGLLTTFVIPSA